MRSRWSDGYKADDIQNRYCIDNSVITNIASEYTDIGLMDCSVRKGLCDDLELCVVDEERLPMLRFGDVNELWLKRGLDQ